jgi:hypothetical protein
MTTDVKIDATMVMNSLRSISRITANPTTPRGTPPKPCPVSPHPPPQGVGT